LLLRPRGKTHRLKIRREIFQSSDRYARPTILAGRVSPPASATCISRKRQMDDFSSTPMAEQSASREHCGSWMRAIAGLPTPRRFARFQANKPKLIDAKKS